MLSIRMIQISSFLRHQLPILVIAVATLGAQIADSFNISRLTCKEVLRKVQALNRSRRSYKSSSSSLLPLAIVEERRECKQCSAPHAQTRGSG